jgi:hypothetical protein
MGTRGRARGGSNVKGLAELRRYRSSTIRRFLRFTLPRCLLVASPTPAKIQILNASMNIKDLGEFDALQEERRCSLGVPCKGQSFQPRQRRLRLHPSASIKSGQVLSGVLAQYMSEKATIRELGNHLQGMWRL